jgi:glycosyltransferase 2 family protein
LEKKTRFWKNLFSIVTILLSIGILTFFLFEGNGANNLRHVVFNLQPAWLLCILGGVIAGWFLESYVLHLFCRHLKKDWTFGQSFYVGMVELYYSAITPFCMGEPMEIYNMNKMGMDVGVASSIVAVKSILHHGVTFLYALVLISFKLNYFQTTVSNFSFVSLFGLVTNSIFIAGVFLFMMDEKLTNSILQVCIKGLNKLKLKKAAQKLDNKVHQELALFHNASKMIGKSYMLYSYAIFLTFIQITVASFISYFVYRSFNLKNESVLIIIAADTFVTMAASFIPLPGSSGGAEGGFYLFLKGFFGSSIVPAITLWRVATYYINILFCGLYVYILKRKYRPDAFDL